MRLLLASLAGSLLSMSWAGAGVLLDQREAAPAAPIGAASTTIQSKPDDLSILLAPGTSDPERLDAARRLVLRNDAPTVNALRDSLRDAGASTQRRAVATAIGAVDPGSPRFAGALREGLLASTTRECAQAVLAALGTYPARIACEAAIGRLLAGDTPEPIAREISSSLRAWTGCDACARAGTEGWLEWWARAKDLDNGAWHAELATNFRARAERFERQREDIVVRHLDLLNRHFSLTPAERRGELIAAMLRDDLTRVKRLGLDLASRTLLNAQPLGSEVAPAAAALLSSEDEDVRAGAARLLENLGGVEHADAVARALDLERSTRIAAPLLRLASRLDLESLPDAVMLRWLASPDPASSAAADALLACEGGRGLAPESRRQALEILRAMSDDAMTVSHARLLAALSRGGDDARLDRLMHGHENAQVRAAAAGALAASASRVESVLSAAFAHAELFPAACDAVLAHRATPSGFLRLIALSPREDSSIPQLARVLEGFDPARRPVALRAVSDASLRESLLVALLARLENDDRADDRELHELLAKTRLSLGDAQGALASAIRAINDDDGSFPAAMSIRFHALVMLNRLDEAMEAGKPASAWLDALERCAAMPHAPEVAAFIASNFGSTMTDDEHARLERLSEGLDARESPPGLPDPAKPG